MPNGHTFPDHVSQELRLHALELLHDPVVLRMHDVRRQTAETWSQANADDAFSRAHGLALRTRIAARPVELVNLPLDEVAIVLDHAQAADGPAQQPLQRLVLARRPPGDLTVQACRAAARLEASLVLTRAPLVGRLVVAPEVVVAWEEVKRGVGGGRGVNPRVGR